MNSGTNFGVYKSTAILIELIKSFLQLLLLLNRYDGRSPHDLGKYWKISKLEKTIFSHLEQPTLLRFDKGDRSSISPHDMDTMLEM